MFGWRSDEVQGRPVRTVPPERRAEFQQCLEQALSGVRSESVHTVRQRSDGALMDVVSTLAPHRAVTGDVIGAVEILCDETELRQVERQRRALLRAQEISAGAESVDDAGPPFLQTLCEMGGWDHAELWTEVSERRVLRRSSIFSACRSAGAAVEAPGIPPELQPGSGLPGLVWQQRRPVFVPEIMPPNENGLNLCPVLSRHAAFGIPLILRKELLGVVTVSDPALTDPGPELRRTLQSIAQVIAQFLERQRRAADLVEVQAKLRQSQKMDAVGLLTGGIAHDFNNVLTVILSYSELAGEEIEPDHSAHEMLTEIFNAGQRAATMTRRLLTFSRQQDEQPVLINPNDMVADIERMLRRLIGSNVVLETRLADAIGPIRADAGQLEQVLVNFVVNARDAMPTGGRITISTCERTFRSADIRRHPGARSGDYIGIGVADTGCGMDEATRARMFEPFFTTKAPGRGTGMGLATVAAIIKHAGGFIEVDTAPGRGTSMQVFLPRSRETLVTQSFDTAPGDCPSGTETIVVVEPDETIRTLVRRIIQVRGYQVLEAVDGGDVLRLFQEAARPISLVLTGVVMEDMSGRDLAHQLRRISPSTRVMFLVDCTEERQLTGTDEPGGVLQKPFTSDALARKIRAVLDAQS
jgi:PAS domain S-box-containing protein